MLKIMLVMIMFKLCTLGTDRRIVNNKKKARAGNMPWIMLWLCFLPDTRALGDGAKFSLAGDI